VMTTMLNMTYVVAILPKELHCKSEQGGTHDLVDVPDRHRSHCRVRVGALEE
jgi:hypothetical protein